MMFYDFLESHKGTLIIAADEEGIRHIDFQEGERPLTIKETWIQRETPDIATAKEQLREYFAGKREQFNLKLAPQGTTFQRDVWDQLCKIPFGEVIHYGELALRLGKPTASRAVGAANGRNPISIVIPCHRVIGKNGTLTGYAGGIPFKSWLLDLEGRA